MLKWSQVAQEFQLFLTIKGNIDKTPAPRHHSAQAQKQNLIKRIKNLRLLAWIADS